MTRSPYIPNSALRRNYKSIHRNYSILQRIRRLCAIALLFILTVPAHPGDRAISLTQEAELPGWYSAELSLKSPIVDGTFTLRNETPLPAPEDFPDKPVNPVGNLGLRTWSLALKPARFFAVSAGALALSGLPARAKNPFFTLTRPHYVPLIPSEDPVIRAGTSLDADNLALEYGTNHWNLAAAGDPRNRLDDPAWILITRRFGSREAGAKRLDLSLFGGAHASVCREETSWFLDEPFKPTTNVYIPGVEAAFCGKIFTGSATVLASVGPFHDPAYLVRSDCSMTGRYCALMAGYAQSYGDFIPLDAKRESLLRRAFIAPSLTLFPRRKANSARRGGPRARTPPEIRLGGIAISDLNRRERYYEEDLASRTIGGFCALSAEHSSLEIQCMAKKDETTLSGRFSLSPPKSIPLDFAASAKTTIPKGGSGILDGKDLTVSAGTVWTHGFSRNKRSVGAQAPSVETTITGTATRPTPSDNAELSGTLGLALSLFGRHSRIRLRAEAGISQGDEPWRGALGLETELR